MVAEPAAGGSNIAIAFQSATQPPFDKSQYRMSDIILSSDAILLHSTTRRNVSKNRLKYAEMPASNVLAGIWDQKIQLTR